MISIVSASLVVSYAVAPVSVAALRKSHPDMNRPFRVKALGVIGPLAFVVATFIVYWTGWQNLSWLLGAQVVFYIGYLIVMRKTAMGNLTFSQQVGCSLWLVGYYLMTLLASYLGPFGGVALVAHPYDFLMVCAVALLVYYWGANTGVPSRFAQAANGAGHGITAVNENAYAKVAEQWRA